MTRTDYDSMPLDDLWALHEEISAKLSARIIAEKLELEKRLARLSGESRQSSGSSGETLGRSVVTRRKYPQVLPKYRNPDAPHETWSGRGKQPRWLAKALTEGSKIEDFRISVTDRRRA